MVALSSGGTNPALLAEQSLEFGVPLVGVARGTAVQDLQLALYAAAKHRGYSAGDFGLPRILAGPDAAEQVASSRATSCSTPSRERWVCVRRWPHWRRAHPGAGQQGVADHRRRGGDLGGRAGPDRARRLRALGAGPVPARRPRRRGTTPGRHRERGPVPRSAARGPRRRDPGAGDGPPHLGHGADGHDELLHAGQQGARGHRGPPAVRRAVRRHPGRRTPAVGRSTRWWSSSTARPSPRSRPPT